MPVDLRFEVFGDVQLNRRLLAMEAATKDMRPVFTDIADDFNVIEAKQFDSQGTYASGGWAQLAAATVKAKAEHKPPLDPRILHATLAMRNSLTRRGAVGAHRVIGKDAMSVTSTVKSKKGFPYPAAHQKPKPGSRLKRRRPVELRDEDRVRWVKKVQAHVVGLGRP